MSTKEKLHKCTTCNQLLSIKVFPNTVDHPNRCKFCNAEKCRSFYDRFRGKRIEYFSDRYKKHSERLKAINLRRSKTKKGMARKKVHLARLRGEITRKPCEVCGETKVDGHHEDYNEPLDVRWLCRKHHMEQHRKFNRTPKDTK